MKNIDLSNYELINSDGVFILKNINTTIGFVRFSDKGEIEYIFVNPIFRKKGLAKKLLKLVREKTNKELVFQKPISPLGSKLLKSLNKRT
jgi:GNAT superfamily N-acetyltransferase